MQPRIGSAFESLSILLRQNANQYDQKIPVRKKSGSPYSRSDIFFLYGQYGLTLWIAKPGRRRFPSWLFCYFVISSLVSSFSGKVIRTWVPILSLLSIAISPPKDSMIRLHTTRPSPVPFSFDVKNGVKIFSKFS